MFVNSIEYVNRLLDNHFASSVSKKLEDVYISTRKGYTRKTIYYLSDPTKSAFEILLYPINSDDLEQRISVDVTHYLRINFLEKDSIESSLKNIYESLISKEIYEGVAILYSYIYQYSQFGIRDLEIKHSHYLLVDPTLIDEGIAIITSRIDRILEVIMSI